MPHNPGGRNRPSLPLERGHLHYQISAGNDAAVSTQSTEKDAARCFGTHEGHTHPQVIASSHARSPLAKAHCRASTRLPPQNEPPPAAQIWWQAPSYQCLPYPAVPPADTAGRVPSPPVAPVRVFGPQNSTHPAPCPNLLGAEGRMLEPL